MIKLSERAKAVTPSQTIQLDSRAKALQATGVPIINLTAGELDFETPDTVIEYARTTLTQQHNHYSPPQGIPEVREAISQYLTRRYQLSYTLEQVIVSNGAKQALFIATQALVSPGDEVLIIQPGWVSYREQIQLCGGVPVPVETTTDFQLDSEAIQAAITLRTVGIIINYPNNPTGAVYSAEQLKSLAAIVQNHNIWVISDEMYAELLYDNTQFISFGSLAPEHTIVINGVSKVGAMTGWRVGWACGPVAVIKAMIALQSHVSGNVNNLAQLAAAEALRQIDTYLPHWLETLQQRRNIITEWIHSTQLGLHMPAGAFYCFIDISSCTEDSVEFCERLLENYHVALVPGIYFGREAYVRLSFAKSNESLEQACVGLQKCIASYA